MIKYIVHLLRDVNPLVTYNNNVYRISEVSEQADRYIKEYLNKKLHMYIGFNFDFKPYK